MKIRVGTILAIVVAVIVFASCSEYSKVLKGDDYDKKYELAMKFFEEEEYYKSAMLIDQLIPVYVGTEKAEQLNFSLAYCEYYQSDLLMAAYRFKKFASNYPDSEHTEECTFMAAYCQYLESPEFSLDQSSTKEAIQSFQGYLSEFPNSDRRDSVNTLIDVLRYKLEKKSYTQAKQYYKMEQYKSDSVAFANVLKEFPNSEYKEEVNFLIFKSDYLLGINSVTKKKQERLDKASVSYNKFVNSFPESRYSKEANALFENLQKAQLRLNNS